MPKELSHILIAQDVFAQLKASGQALFARVIEKNLPAFYLGAIIPDAFFYDVTPFRPFSQDFAHISRALHQKEKYKNDERALSFFSAIRGNPCQWPLKVAFAAGLVTHTVSDRIIHGVIDYYTTSWSQKGSLATATHRQFETLIDMVLLQRLGLHPRHFQWESLVGVDRTTLDRLFSFYLTHLMGNNRTLHPCLLGALKRAYGQQRFFLRLFTVKALYHIMNLSNRLMGERTGALSSLFYPETIGTEDFRIMDHVDLNSLTDGRSFAGTLHVLVKETTTSALCNLYVGLRRL
jgi:hypothetical protein